MRKFQIVSVLFALSIVNANMGSSKIDNSSRWHLSANSDNKTESYRLKNFNIYGKWISLLPINYKEKRDNSSNLTKTIKKVFKTTAQSTSLAKSTMLSPKKIVAISKIDKYSHIMPSSFENYEEFKKFVNLKKSYKVYQDKKLLSKTNPKDIKIIVNVSLQRVKLLVKDKVALDAPCTTGSKHKFEPNTKTYRDKHTPLGEFKIKEKIANKRSTIFVNIYRNGRLIYHGDKRKYRGSLRGVKIVGAPLYNWMRLTSSGIGLHASSHVKRYPGSNGCIRLPKRVANTIFSRVSRGTIVKVVQ